MRNKRKGIALQNRSFYIYLKKTQLALYRAASKQQVVIKKIILHKSRCSLHTIHVEFKVFKCAFKNMTKNCSINTLYNCVLM